MFAGCKNFNRELNYWDVSEVTNMSYMFAGCKKFNQPLNWNVRNETNISCMFANSDTVMDTVNEKIKEMDDKINTQINNRKYKEELERIQFTPGHVKHVLENSPIDIEDINFEKKLYEHPVAPSTIKESTKHPPHNYYGGRKKKNKKTKKIKKRRKLTKRRK
jgi:surface protein